MYELKNEIYATCGGKMIDIITVRVDDENERAEICNCINQVMSGQHRENIEKLENGIRGQKQIIEHLTASIKSLEAEKERLKNANTTISGMYWEQMNKNIEQKKKIEELEAKHWDECRQIAQYDNDLKRLFNEILECLNGMTKAADHILRIFKANFNPYNQPDKSPAPNVEHVNCKCEFLPIDAETATKRILDKMANKKATMNTGDYFNSDGLLVCGKCRLPKECEFEAFGKMQTFPCLCGCGKANETAGGDVRDANNNEPSKPENKTTNFDKIKELGVEGMAEFLNCIANSCDKGDCEGCPIDVSAVCTKKTIADWLKNEYTGDRTSEVSE